MNHRHVLRAQGGQLRLVVGASGGPRIISATLQTIVRTLLLGWSPLQVRLSGQGKQLCYLHLPVGLEPVWV